MLCREIIAVFFVIHTKQIQCGQNVQLYIFGPYRAVNTLRLGYKNKPVSAV